MCGLDLYPTGSKSDSVGQVSAFVWLDESNSKVSTIQSLLEIEIAITIGDKTKKTSGRTVSHYAEAAFNFGKSKGRGWSKFCPCSMVMTNNDVEVGYEMLVTTLPSKTITVTPTGKCVHDYTTTTIDFTKK